MGEIVNLRRVRKARERAERAEQAERNRLVFGRARAERTLTAAERALVDHRLDGHRLDQVDIGPSATDEPCSGKP